jgi:hypothetical protein
MSLGGIRTYVGHARVRLINRLELEPRCRASLFKIILHGVRSGFKIHINMKEVPSKSYIQAVSKQGGHSVGDKNSVYHYFAS